MGCILSRNIFKDEVGGVRKVVGKKEVRIDYEPASWMGGQKSRLSGFPLTSRSTTH